MKNIIKINVGDGSGDGHCINTPIFINSNLSLKEFEKAYEEACNITNFQWNTNGNYTNKNGTWLKTEDKILNNYNCNELTSEQITMFGNHNINCKDNLLDDPYNILKLFMEFIKIGNEKFTYEINEKDILPEFKYSIGYGCFDDL